MLLNRGARNPGFSVCLWICFTWIYVRAYIHTHIYTSSFKKILRSWCCYNVKASLSESFLNHVPHCKNKHIQRKESQNAIAVCPSSHISTVLCLSVVLAWKESVTSHSASKRSSFIHCHWFGFGVGVSSPLGFPFSSSSSLMAWIWSEGCCWGDWSRDGSSMPANLCSSSMTFFHILWFCRRCWVIWQ